MKIEMHAHTSEVSPCSHITAASLVQTYAGLGYDVLMVTGHFNDYVLEAYRGCTPAEAVDRYLEGYRRALEEAERWGIRVWLGVECCLQGGKHRGEWNDFLFYGIDREFLLDHPRLYNLTQKEAFLEAESAGILMYQAHPFRYYCTPQDPEYMHGAEVYNGQPCANNNEKALKWAKKHGLRQSAGSDCHRAEYAGIAGIIVPDYLRDEKALAAYMRDHAPELVMKR